MADISPDWPASPNSPVVSMVWRTLYMSVLVGVFGDLVVTRLVRTLSATLKMAAINHSKTSASRRSTKLILFKLRKV